MKADVHVPFIEAVMELRGRAPREMELFIVALKQVADQKAIELVRAPVESIYQLQGQARALSELVRMVEGAPELFNKIKEIRDASRRTG